MPNPTQTIQLALQDTRTIQINQIDINLALLRAIATYPSFQIPKKLTDPNNNWGKFIFSEDAALPNYLAEFIMFTLYRTAKGTIAPHLYIAAPDDNNVDIFDAFEKNELIQYHQREYTEQVNQNITLLQLIVKHPCATVRQELITTKINWGNFIFSANGLFKHYLLKLGAHLGDLALVQKLINLGVDVDTTTETGEPILHVAAKQHNTEIVKLLVNAGADINCRNKEGYNAVGLALSTQNIHAFNAFKPHHEHPLKLVNFLISKGIELPAVDLKLFKEATLDRNSYSKTKRVLQEVTTLNATAKSITEPVNKAHLNAHSARLNNR